MEMFQVGGSVRDEILGVKSKDIDFSVVLTQEEKSWTWNGGTPWHETLDPFPYMVSQLKNLGFEIFLESPEFLTVRARFPRKEVKMNGGAALNSFQFANPGLTADFVLARCEGNYTDGRRPDMVEPGTLQDDLARRDFTMNAIAKDITGNLIDPFNGQADIKHGLIRAVGNAEERISEDALRGLRAIRFAVTKGFFIHSDISNYLRTTKFRESLRSVSQDRVREEMHKAFKHDTVSTISYLERYGLLHTIFDNGLWLEPTTKS